MSYTPVCQRLVVSFYCHSQNYAHSARLWNIGFWPGYIAADSPRMS